MIKTLVRGCNDAFGVCYRRGSGGISGFPVWSHPPPPRVNSWLRVHVTSFARAGGVSLAPSCGIYFYRRAAASESREDSFASLPQSEQREAPSQRSWLHEEARGRITG